MNAKLDILAKEITKAARLGKKESGSLYKELVSDFVERERDLILSGMTGEQVYLAVAGEFGDAKELGKSFYYANQPLSKIPLLGEMLYFRPLRLATALGLSEIFVYVAGFWGSMLVLNLISTFLDSSQGPSTLMNLIEVGFLLAVFVVMESLQGWIAYKKVNNIPELFQAHVILYLPFVVWGVVQELTMHLTVGGSLNSQTEGTIGVFFIGLFLVDTFLTMALPVVADRIKHAKR